MAHKILIALDLDRTLTKESATMGALETACSEQGVNVEKMRYTQRQTERIGGTFFPLVYLSKLLPSRDVTTIKNRFKEIAKRKSLLYADVLPFLKCLSARAVPLTIVTYGGNDWQKLKIEASQLHYYSYIITDQKVKGILIKTWYKDKLYIPYPKDTHLSAQKVLLIDDKASSFNMLPKDCYGYLVRRPSEPILPSQKGSVPANVDIVPGLMDIIDSLNKKHLIP